MKFYVTVSLAQCKLHSLTALPKVGLCEATQGAWSWIPQLELELQ